MSNTDKLREIAEKWMPMVRYKDKERFIEVLTALISEHYYPKEFVRWMMHTNIYMSLNPRKDKVEQLFNYWKENEQ